jgi:non-homologous end joining protein Ku
LRGIKRKRRTEKENFETLMLDDYEKQKYITQGDARLSMGYSEDTADVDIVRFESMDEIDYLYEDESVYISSIID